jgi:hypothetical protein
LCRTFTHEGPFDDQTWGSRSLDAGSQTTIDDRVP